MPCRTMNSFSLVKFRQNLRVGRWHLGYRPLLDLGVSVSKTCKNSSVVFMQAHPIKGNPPQSWVTCFIPFVSKFSKIQFGICLPLTCIYCSMSCILELLRRILDLLYDILPDICRMLSYAHTSQLSLLKPMSSIAFYRTEFNLMYSI